MKQRIAKFRGLLGDLECNPTYLGMQKRCAGEDPLLEIHRWGACRSPFLLTGWILGSRKEKLCSGESKGECRYDLSAIPWGYIFIAKVDVGRFIEPCWIEMQWMEGKRPLQRSRRPCMAEWENNGCRDHGRKISFARVFYVIIWFWATDLDVYSLWLCVSNQNQRLTLRINQLKIATRGHI